MSLCKFTGFTVFPGSFRYTKVLAVGVIVVSVVCQFQPACVLMNEGEFPCYFVPSAVRSESTNPGGEV
jgi:hypothetical protein